MITQLENSVKAGSRANSSDVDAFIREYKQKKWAPNSSRMGKPDSLSAWYSIEEMENFLALARANGGDGIRFYFAAYPEDYAPKPEYAGRHTLVQVATRSKITASGAVANKDIYSSKNGRLKILSGGLPNMCPPNCNPPAEGGMGDLGITLVDRGEQGMEIV